jgi:hypothetical protein
LFGLAAGQQRRVVRQPLAQRVRTGGGCAVVRNGSVISNQLQNYSMHDCSELL